MYKNDYFYQSKFVVEYYEVVTASLKRYSTQCAADVKKAFEDTEELVTSKGGAKKIKKLFKYVLP